MTPKTLTIVGMGPGIGLALAQRFGREGYRVGMLSRSQDRLDGYAETLASKGIEAAGFAADVLDRTALARALDRIRERFGRIDTLEYSPLLDMLGLVDVLHLDPEEVRSQIDFQLLGAIASVRTVLGEMSSRGEGALLFTTGASAQVPAPSHANGALGVVALRQYARMLHMALEPRGIYVGSISIAKQVIPAEIADLYWDMIQKRDVCERLYGDPRLLCAYEELIALGVADVFPPGLNADLPAPRDARQRESFLVALYHIQQNILARGAPASQAEHMADLAEGLGGDRNEPCFGADPERVLPAPAST